MKKKFLLNRNNGLTLIEVLIAMAFMALLYAFVVQVFFNGFASINIGDIEDEGVRLASNELTRLSSYDNPLYIGLQYKDGGQEYIDKLKSGELSVTDLVDQGVLTLKNKETIRDNETSDNSEEIKKSSRIANYTRVTEWEIIDAQPILIHLWVTVKWSDPRKVFQDGSYAIETMLSH